MFCSKFHVQTPVPHHAFKHGNVAYICVRCATLVCQQLPGKKIAPKLCDTLKANH